MNGSARPTVAFLVAMIGFAAAMPSVSARGTSAGTAPPPIPARTQPAKPHEWIVRTNQRVSPRELAEKLEARGVDRIGKTGFDLVTFARDVSTHEALARARAIRAVASMEPNYIRVTTGQTDEPADPLTPQQWGLTNTGQAVNGVVGTAGADTRAIEAWKAADGDGAVLAVVDDGLDLGHPDVVPNLWTNPNEVPGNGVDDDSNGYVDDVTGWDFIGGDADVSPGKADHGTHVAGIAAARAGNGFGTAGVAPSAQIMPLRVFDESGVTTSAALLEAFSYAAAMGADVVNGSFAGRGLSQSEATVIREASGTIFVFAAGNGLGSPGTDNDTDPRYPCAIDAANLVCVAATDQNDMLAPYSNYGPTTVDLGAPGTNVLSLQPFSVPYPTEDFDAPLDGRWITGGTNNTWARVSFEAPIGNVLEDSPDDPYIAGTSSWAQVAQPVDLTGREDCELRYRAVIDTEPAKDYLLVQTSSDGRSWENLAQHSGSGARSGAEPLTAYEGGALYARFQLLADGGGLAHFEGVKIDDVSVRCYAFAYDSTTFDYYSGTSMASPHVAGALAVLSSYAPATPPSDLIAALLAGVDPLPALEGMLASGGRLNVRASLEVLGADFTEPPPEPVLEITDVYDAPDPFSPNRDGRRDRVTISFTITGEARVRVTVRRLEDDRRVRLLLSATETGAGPISLRWRGRNDKGRPAPAGTYLYRIVARTLDDTQRLVSESTVQLRR